MIIQGQLVDIHKRDIYPAVVEIQKGKIVSITRDENISGYYILPGLIDSHIHIESSMVTPGAFACEAVRHGTTGVVSDPHEIANVLGIEGVNYMINDAAKVPVRYWFGAPSCVPATNYETSGGYLNYKEINKLLRRPEIKYLSEMMNFPGVIYDDKEVHLKLGVANELGKPVDGHAPGLTGEKLKKYIESGISTDHECSTMKEALEKISLGVKILIREGSAAKNLDSLKELYKSHPGMIMLCSDDLHPEMLRKGHINKLVGRLISEGYDIYDVIRSATINPVEHYNLEAGLLQPGQNADFILVDDLDEMNVIETWINGGKVFADGKSLVEYIPGKPVNNFKCDPINLDNIRIRNEHKKIRVIEAFDGDLLTKEIICSSGNNDYIESDINNDILKIIVKDRYENHSPTVGFIKGFGLKKGAFASSIAHDSHNIIALGTNDEDIICAVNEVVKHQGGIAVAFGSEIKSLKLNVAGIMTTRKCELVARDYEDLNKLVKSYGCVMSAPFMTLAFMALLVIPELKIGDRGLFNVSNFEMVDLFLP